MMAGQGYEPFGSLLPGRNYSSGAYRFGFNGAEKDDEVHGITGTSYDFGARMYDNRVARFLSLDPEGSKTPFQSAYLFAGNTPIAGIDLDGKVLVITTSSSPSATALFQKIVSDALDGMFEIQITPLGVVSVVPTGVAGPVSEQQQAFLNVLNNAISASGTMSLTMVENNDAVLVGSYALSAIDMADVEKFGALGGAISAAGVLGHEIAEQQGKQLDYPASSDPMYGYDFNHNSSGHGAQEAIDKSHRHDSSVLPSTSTKTEAVSTMLPNGRTVETEVVTGNLDQLYSKGGKGYNVSMQLDRNNVTSVTQTPVIP
jgi:RHS repeat-associated protein